MQVQRSDPSGPITERPLPARGTHRAALRARAESPPCTRRNTTDGAGDWEAVGVGRAGRCMTVPEVQRVQAGSGGQRQAGGSSSLRLHVPALPALSCSIYDKPSNDRPPRFATQLQLSTQ